MLGAKHFCRAIFFAVFTLGITIPLVRADTSHSTAGAGTRLCSAFLQEYEQDPKITAWIYLSWAQGYLSAINLQRSQIGETAVDMLPSEFDLPRQIAFLRTYCRGLPDRYFDQAAIEMYYELFAHKSKTFGSQSLP